MDESRGSSPGLDHKSVEIKPLPTRRKSKNKPKKHPLMTLTVTRKRCSTCSTWFRAETPEGLLGAFSRDNTNVTDGLQPQCKNCRRHWERGGIFSRTRAMIESEGGAVLAAWERCRGGLEAELRRIWDACDGVCFWCGCDPREWAAGGHCLDRRNNDHDHYPWNVVICCWPDNRTKGTKTPEAYTAEAEGRLRKWALRKDDPASGRGRVQWDHDDRHRWKRIRPLDLSSYVDPDQSDPAPPDEPSRQLHLFDEVTP